MSRLRGCLLVLCLVSLSACGGGSGNSGANDGGLDNGGLGDAGVNDAGVNDAGTSDGGGNVPDAGSGLTLTLSPGTLSIRQFQGRSTPLRVNASVRGTDNISGTVQVVIVDSAGVLRPYVDIQRGSDGVYRALLSTQPGLGLGQHQGTFEIHLCADSSCQQQYTQASLPYDITVLNEFETHQSPLSPWTGIGDWTTAKGDAAHRGHVPVQLDPTRFSQRWLWRDINPVMDPTYASLSTPVSVSADGTAYLLSLQGDGWDSGSVIYALNESNGSPRWSYDLGDTRASAPTVAEGRVYLLTGEDSGGRFWSLDARTGSATLEASIPLTQAYHYGPAQPIIVGQKAYISFGGDTAETKALDASSGKVLWSVASGGNYRVPFAVDGQRLYFFRPYWSLSREPEKNFGFTALDLATGGTAFTIVKPPSSPMEGNIQYRGSTPVLTGNGRALVNRGDSTFGNSLDCVDLETHTVVWQLEGGFEGSPTVVGEVFYIINSSYQLEARSVVDGHLLWSWRPNQGIGESLSFSGDIVATDNLLFFSTDQQVYALNVETRSIVWSYPAPGSLSLSASRILYIVRYARSSSGNLVVEGKVAAINLH
jgi:outer membrane protein assembly factor BamB